MTINSKLQLLEVIKNNKNWPLLVSGTDIKDFDNAFIVDTQIDEQELHHKSNWEENLSGKDFLLIQGLDKAIYKKQEKFVSLLKDRRFGSYALPKDIQIVISVQNLDKVSPKLQALSLIWKAIK